MDETVLLPGARFRLGQVELKLLEAPSAEVVPAAATMVITACRPFHHHPRVEASWWCPGSGRFFVRCA